MKKSRKIAEGLAPLETVIFLDFEGMQCPVFLLQQTHLQGEAENSQKRGQRFHSLNFSSHINFKYHSVLQAVPRGLLFVQHLAAIGHVSSKRETHASPYISTTGASHDLTRTSGPIKGRDRRGLQNLEVKMKLVTRFELAAKSQNELRGLLRVTFSELARSEPDSHQRRNALATIENIQNELASRTLRP